MSDTSSPGPQTQSQQMSHWFCMFKLYSKQEGCLCHCEEKQLRRVSVPDSAEKCLIFIWEGQELGYVTLNTGGNIVLCSLTLAFISAIRFTYDRQFSFLIRNQIKHMWLECIFINFFKPRLDGPVTDEGAGCNYRMFDDSLHSYSDLRVWQLLPTTSL